MPKTQYNFKLPEDLLARLKEKASQDDTNTTALIIRGIEKVLEIEDPSKAYKDKELYENLYQHLNWRLSKVEIGIEVSSLQIKKDLSHLRKQVLELSEKVRHIEYVTKETS